MSNFFFKSHAGPHHLIGRRGHGIPEGPRSLKENVPDQEEAGACRPIRSHQTRFNIFVHWPGSCRKRPSAPRTVKEGRVPQILFFFLHHLPGRRGHGLPEGPRSLEENVGDQEEAGTCRPIRSHQTSFNIFVRWPGSCRKRPRALRTVKESRVPQILFFASFDRTTRTRTSRRPSKPRRKRWRPRRGRNLQTNPKPPDQIRHFCTLAREPPKKTESLEDRKGGQGTTNTFFLHII